jgi:hypothetical protein
LERKEVFCRRREVDHAVEPDAAIDDVELVFGLGSARANSLGGGREGWKVLPFEKIDFRSAERRRERRRRHQDKARPFRDARKFGQRLGRTEPRQKQSGRERLSEVGREERALGDHGQLTCTEARLASRCGVIH